MGKVLAILAKVLPFLPSLIDMVVKMIQAFKKPHDPSQIEGVAADEVKKLSEASDSLKEKEAAEWNIVKGED